MPLAIYDAVISNQTMGGKGYIDSLAKSYAFGNSLTSGITDIAATWLGGGARFLGDTFNSQALKDFVWQTTMLEA